ncbi:MAG: hypothetical protein GX442_22105 [Candidatus Riflebacteria bacterium]|nr:hypothetical protein [Candidatus Riflebacteria bacterium]
MSRLALTLLGMVLCLGWTETAAARPPDVRFPDWYKTTLSVKAWNPATREIRVALTVEAPLVPIHDLAAAVAWPAGFTGGSPRQSIGTLAQGKSWAAEFTARGPETFDGWVEISGEGRPDRAGLRQAIERPGAYAPSVRTILLSEVEGVTGPLPFGLSLPLCIRPDLAAAVPAAFLPEPRWPVGERALHLWAPAGSFELPAVQARFADWQKAVVAGNAAPARQAATALLAALGSTDALDFVRADGTPLTITGAMARQFVRVSLDALHGLELSRTQLGALLKDLGRTPPALTDGFRAANLGVLLAAKGAPAEADRAWGFALERLPAWNLVKGWRPPPGRKP